LEEQRAIADVFATLDREQKVHERKHAGLTDLFRSLLHQLMTAQIRANDIDLDEILLQRVAETEHDGAIVGNGRDRSLHEDAAGK
jgi:type I restriction enzyme S subunit